MVLDNLENIGKYCGLGGGFVTAAKFLKSADLNALPVGKTEIDGKNVYISVSEYDTKSESEGRFEAHDNYADIQVIISGAERMDYAERAKCAAISDYNPEKDVVFLSAQEYSRLIVNGGCFAVFLPDDAHRPNLSVSGAAKVKKAVVKVRL